MKDLFTALLDLLDCRGDIIEALMYSGGDFSRIKIEKPSGTYTISISKENETDVNDKENINE